MKILILANHEVAVYNQRLELIQELVSKGHEVYISAPNGEKIDKLKEIGCIHIPMISNDRHGKNVIRDISLLRYYIKVMKNKKYDWVFTFNTKPNIYGSIAANYTKTKSIVNITGLGNALEHKSALQKIMILLYKLALNKANYIFFQNQSNLDFFKEHKIISHHPTKIIPGSGVNTEKFEFVPYPNNDTVHFAFISRIMKSKGIELYLETAKKMVNKYDNCYFHVAGFCDEPYENILTNYEKSGIIKYHGMITNLNEFIKDIDCVVHPTYYPEGMANILLESAAMGRPVITTDRPGCREAVEHDVTGILIKERSQDELFKAVEKVYHMSDEKRKQIGRNARSKMLKEFQRSRVISTYLEVINMQSSDNNE